jgi:hypothetical protein
MRIEPVPAGVQYSNGSRVTELVVRTRVAPAVAPTEIRRVRDTL